MADTTVKPVLPSGFRDYAPSDVIPRTEIIAKIRATFERFGFDPLETPGMELKRTLTGDNPDFSMPIYDTRISGKRIVSGDNAGDFDTAMRFDLTVPLARYVAANRDKLVLPFKRYQIGNVWRGEKSQAGRFREFMQFDADIVGTSTPLADAEVIALMVESMRAIDLERFDVRFNNRKILNGLPAYAGFAPDQVNTVLRIIDKLPKIGRDAVLRELGKPTRADSSGEDEEGSDLVEASYGLGMTPVVVGKIEQFLNLCGPTDVLLAECVEMFAGTAVAKEGLAELRTIVDALREMNVPETNWRVDLSVARGLAYYTGPVFETYLSDLPGIGSVFSGGRYDDLVSRFSATNVPATGASVGVDRLFAALSKLDALRTVETLTQVLVTVMDPALTKHCLAITGELRGAGLRTALWLGQETSLRHQLGYASRLEIPVAIVLGGDEAAAGAVTVRNMRDRTQQRIPRSDLVRVAKQLLGC